jgi:integrase
MQSKITKRLIDSLKTEARDYYVFDTELTGFAVRVRVTGSMSYIVQYKAGKGRGAPTRRISLGLVGRMTPDEARAKARDELRSPATDNRRAAPGILDQVIDDYLRDHAAKRKGSTNAWVTSIAHRVIKPAFGKMDMNKVTRQDVACLHSSLNETPVAANRALAVLRALYSWAGRHGHVNEGFNPARNIEKFPERPRERYLTHEEFARLGDALRDTSIDPGAVAAIRLLVLTGARLREIINAKWEYADFDRALLNLPDSKTGRKPIYLGATTLEILHNLPRKSVFIVPNQSGQVRGDLKRPRAAITKAAKLDGLRIHDLRHSFASVGAAASLGLPIIGKLLGHSEPATTARYAHLDSDPMHAAVNMIGMTIEAAMRGEDRKVIPLRTGSH